MAATAKKNKIPNETMASERAEIEARIAELRRMEGKPVELVRQAQAVVQERQAEIAGLEAHLAELDAQTGASVKAEREAAQQEYAKRIFAMRQELLHHHEMRLNAIRKFEDATRAMKEAATCVLIVNEKLRQNVFVLGGEERRTPMALSEGELVSRLSSRFSSVMMNISSKHRSTFGGIKWSSAMRGYTSAQNWTDEEEKLIAPDIQKILNSEQGHD